MNQKQAITRILSRTPANAVVVSCNGIISRDAHAAADRPANFYMIGSMGLASSIGLGAALSRPDLPVVVLDGDGNVLMGLGALASIGASKPSNVRHVVLDSRTYQSTGGQATISAEVDLEGMARAAGYHCAELLSRIEELDAGLDRLFEGSGPSWLRLVVESGEKPFSPRVSHEPAANAERVRQALKR